MKVVCLIVYMSHTDKGKCCSMTPIIIIIIIVKIDKVKITLMIAILSQQLITFVQ